MGWIISTLSWLCLELLNLIIINVVKTLLNLKISSKRRVDSKRLTWLCILNRKVTSKKIRIQKNYFDFILSNEVNNLKQTTVVRENKLDCKRVAFRFYLSNQKNMQIMIIWFSLFLKFVIFSYFFTLWFLKFFKNFTKSITKILWITWTFSMNSSQHNIFESCFAIVFE